MMTCGEGLGLERRGRDPYMEFGVTTHSVWQQAAYLPTHLVLTSTPPQFVLCASKPASNPPS